MPKQSSFRRKAMISRFVEDEHSAKNHREFAAAQNKQPVSLYGRPVGQFMQEQNERATFNSICRFNFNASAIPRR